MKYVIVLQDFDNAYSIRITSFVFKEEFKDVEMNKLYIDSNGESFILCDKENIKESQLILIDNELHRLTNIMIDLESLRLATELS